MLSFRVFRSRRLPRAGVTGRAVANSDANSIVSTPEFTHNLLFGFAQNCRARMGRATLFILDPPGMFPVQNGFVINSVSCG